MGVHQQEEASGVVAEDPGIGGSRQLCAQPLYRTGKYTFYY